MVVTLSPFKANSNSATCCCRSRRSPKRPGTFVNAEGRVQASMRVVKPLAETRPAWKVLRVLGNMLGLPGFDYESAQEVLVAARGDAGRDSSRWCKADLLSNRDRRIDRRLGDTGGQPGHRRRSTSSTASCAARRRCS